eukprot:CAMPEP_0118677700 /NCGR_PEP_ID=MMETSP0800-20121206/2779_1 /TAXON_ID=210618 ORGANISM="Striatella unipunctata, Strain CCMP2910" /NCGR_SAMPLE_ID=MMETSP0800 /ASSEMBLY_ACC=CAM_ASM_000638 /LENGTH=256 /DNA_ID=CAMNT_0006573415 /DNA_START=24 /DNA_END=794 /DNA_ORIENTATION=-
MMMMMMVSMSFRLFFIVLVLCGVAFTRTTSAFVVGVSSSSCTFHRGLFSTAAAPSTDSLLSPEYEIEPISTRIGHGFDIHRMAPIEEAGQPVVIGGVTIEHKDQKWTDKDGTYVEKGGIYECQLGVVAHSDGDVIYHSVVDAIFGALTLPDIGQVFQDTDPRWRGCDSSKFMEHAYDVMDGYGYRIGNIDVTLILERPKVASFKPAMKKNIVELLRTTPGRVNIKARTHEKMDSVGELRSLSCHVVLTLERKKEEE